MIKINRTAVIVVACGLVLAAVLWGVLHRRSAAAPGETNAQTRPFRVMRLDMFDRIVELGEVSAQTIYNLRFPIREKVTSVSVTEDQEVKRGQTLVCIDSRTLLSQEKELEARALEAKYNLDSFGTLQANRLLELEARKIQADLEFRLAQKRLDAAKDMIAQNLLAPDQKEVYEGQVEGARLTLEMLDRERQRAEEDLQKKEVFAKTGEHLEFQLQQTRAALKDCCLQAPIAGKVVWLKKMGLGDFVDPSEVIVRVADMAKIEVRALLFENDIWRIEKNVEVYIQSGEERIPATIKRISRIGETGQGGNKFPCYLDAPNLNDRFRIGSSVEVVFLADKKPGVLVVPLKYLVEKDGAYQVYKQVKGKVVLVPVKIGSDDTKYVEVKSGLAEGDTVLYPLAKS